VEFIFNPYFGSVVLLATVAWQFRQKISDVLVEHQQVSTILIVGSLWLVLILFASAYLLGASNSGGGCITAEIESDMSIADK